MKISFETIIVVMTILADIAFAGVVIYTGFWLLDYAHLFFQQCLFVK